MKTSVASNEDKRESAERAPPVPTTNDRRDGKRICTRCQKLQEENMDFITVIRFNFV